MLPDVVRQSWEKLVVEAIVAHVVYVFEWDEKDPA